MSSHDALNRLAAVAPTAPVLADGEEDRILARVLATPRRRRRPRPLTFALIGVAFMGALAAAVALNPGSVGQDHPHVALTGARIQLAGYRFRTPAGFAASTDKSCQLLGSTEGAPNPGIDGFAAAAGAGGACVAALYDAGPVPDSAAAVPVGDYQGFYVPAQDSGDESFLYVALPHADAGRIVYLLLVARDVTEDELIAIADSGLPTLPPLGPKETTG